MNLTILQGDCLASLRELPSESVNCCVTSPPYFGLRDYGVDGQIGLEQTPDEYIAKLVDVFREVRRVLKDDGTLWVNIGDSYAGNANSGGSNANEGGPAVRIAGLKPKRGDGIKSKDLIGIPWMLAFALRADGWFLRQDLIWSKPNPMPESVTDRCTKSHEYIFLLSKSSRYFYDQDAIKEPIKDASVARLLRGVSEENKLVEGAPGQTPHSVHQPRKNVKFGGNNLCPDTRLQSGKEWTPQMAGGGTSYKNGHSGYFDKDGNPLCGVMANKKSVWSVTTRGYKEAHFATYPPELIKPCILAGCPVGGVVLDPFAGSGTTGKVALENGRSAILCELNPEYIKLIEKRCKVNLPLMFEAISTTAEAVA